MPINIKLEYATEFKRNIRILSKKHRRIKDDLSGLLVDLARGETPGDQITGTGATLYKVRVKNSDSSKGKRLQVDGRQYDGNIAEHGTVFCCGATL